MRGGQSDIWKEEITKAFGNIVGAIRSLQFGRELLDESHKEFADAAAHSSHMDPERLGFADPILEVYRELKTDLGRDNERLNMAARDLAKTYPEKLKALYNRGARKPLGNAKPLLKGPPLA